MWNIDGDEFRYIDVSRYQTIFRDTYKCIKIKLIKYVKVHTLKYNLYTI